MPMDAEKRNSRASARSHIKWRQDIEGKMVKLSGCLALLLPCHERPCRSKAFLKTSADCRCPDGRISRLRDGLYGEREQHELGYAGVVDAERRAARGRYGDDSQRDSREYHGQHEREYRRGDHYGFGVASCQFDGGDFDGGFFEQRERRIGG